MSASESLYGGQFTLSTQSIKPDYLVILPPTQHHSSFKNLPPCVWDFPVMTSPSVNKWYVKCYINKTLMWLSPFGNNLLSINLRSIGSCGLTVGAKHCNDCSRCYSQNVSTNTARWINQYTKKIHLHYVEINWHLPSEVELCPQTRQQHSQHWDEWYWQC